MPTWRNIPKGKVSGKKLEILNFLMVRNNKKNTLLFYSLNLTKKAGMCMHFTEASQFWIDSPKCRPNMHYKDKFTYSNHRVSVLA